MWNEALSFAGTATPLLAAAAAGATAGQFDVNLPWFDFLVVLVALLGIRAGKKRGFSEELLDVTQWLVIVGGPGLGAFRPVYEGNNTIGRAPSNRIPLDFGDETISSEEQAYIRYDSADRAFLFVPNLSKTNVVVVNSKKPTSAVDLSAMDVIVMGRTQLVFMPFCGAEFDWSEITETKD